MRHMTSLIAFALIAALTASPFTIAAAPGETVPAKSDDANNPTPTKPGSTKTGSKKPGLKQPDPRAGKSPKIPHVTVNRAGKYIDVEANVCLNDSNWLELLACARGTKEHEAVLSVKAKASHVHLGLLLIGLKPGSPQKYTKVKDDFKVIKAHGPRVAVTLLYAKDGKQIKVPANKWIVNQKSGKQLEDNIWMFAGSRFEKIRIPIKPLAENIEDQKYREEEAYSADLNGTILSLVNFGDDVLSRDTTLHNRNDNETWGIDMKAVPKVGTDVVIRIKAVADNDKSNKTGKKSESSTSDSPKPKQ